MKIIQHADCFEVRSERGSIVKRFPFDDNSRRRAISGRMTRKQAFQAARTFAGKSYTVETAKPWLEPLFVCQACGARGADIRPDFDSELPWRRASD
jgi:hypothetical protein